MKSTILFFITTLFTFCTPQMQNITRFSDEDPLMKQAQEIAQKYIITDGHVDLPYRLKTMNFRLQKEFIGIPVETDRGDFDWKRAKEGGLDAPFMSIYIPSRYQTEGGAKNFADSLINMVNGIIKAHPDKFAAGLTPQQVDKNFQSGLISLPMGMENGAPVEDDINNVKYFFDRGIRYITLTHSKVNQICDSSYDPERKWNGLSPFGRDVVKEMNRVGIMVDISHVSDSTFYQVMELSRAPVIASHSSCRKYTPGFERNMSDDMIRLLGQKGGVIQINFGSSFLDSEVAKANNANREKLRALFEEKNATYGSKEGDRIIEDFRKNNPSVYADVETVANHIDHVVQLAGIDHVGLGSDFDGVGDSLPTGLKDVSAYPNLLYILLKRGYTEEDLIKICHQNVWRVWNQVQLVASS